MLYPYVQIAVDFACCVIARIYDPKWNNSFSFLGVPALSPIEREGFLS